jgi:thiol-disulfide isomerase/thioredoxin
MNNNEEDNCPICIDKIIDNIKITNCNHKFHKHCLDEWLKYNNSCPYCRSEINKPEPILTEFMNNMNQREAGNINYINSYYINNSNLDIQYIYLDDNERANFSRYNIPFNLYPESREPSGIINLNNIYNNSTS